LNDEFFTGDKSRLDDDATLQQMESSAGYDPAQIKQCTSDPATETAVKAQMNEIVKTQFFGTPTVFINGKALVGPKPYRVYAIMLRGLFYW
jgi:2-hydroxychromene-2-carboxylate isomerase